MDEDKRGFEEAADATPSPGKRLFGSAHARGCAVFLRGESLQFVSRELGTPASPLTK